MAPYVTPEKLYLLVLIQIYWSGAVPESSTIPILSYITSRAAPRIGGSSNSDLDVGSILTVDLSGLRKLLTSISHTHAGGSLYKNLWEDFMHQLVSIHDLDTLMGFSGRCNHVFDCPEPHNIQLNPTSLLGGFVRKTLLELGTLPFFDVMKLWREFDIHRTPVTNEYLGVSASGDDFRDPRRNTGDKTLEVINMALPDLNAKHNTLSSDSASKLLEFQIERMQSFGARLPIELRQTLHQMLTGPNDTLPSLHHMHFLDAWYGGDYASAFENLHRYYDYAMRNNDRSQYQYALLDMTILHADFACYDEAMIAINETIAAARESKDMPCLTFSLSWLYYFELRTNGSRHKGSEHSILGTGMSGLKFLASEARKLEMRSIESSVKLFEAGDCLFKGHKPREVFERIYEASHLNLYHNLGGSMSSEMQARSSIFDRLGMKSTSQAYCNLVSECYGSITPVDGIVRAHCSTAESLVAAGSYEEAFAVLAQIRYEASHNLSLSQYLAQVTAILKLKKALLNHDLNTGQALLLIVKTSPCSDPQFSDVVTLLEIDYLTRLRSLSTAFDLVDSVLSNSTKQGPMSDVSGRIKLMNAKVMLFVKSGRPQKGFSLAMRAATAAYKAKAIPALWEAVGVLGNVLCGLLCYEVAKAVLLAVVYQAVETNDVALCGFLEKTLTDACIGIGHLNKDTIEARNAALRDALHWATTARRSFVQIEDVQGLREMKGRIELLLNVLGSGRTQEEAT